MSKTHAWEISPFQGQTDPEVGVIGQKSGRFGAICDHGEGLVNELSMRIGVISDIHGNRAALRATLDALKRHDVDQWVCLGDAIDPLPGSRPVFEELLRLGIPFLRGNHEDYVIRAFEEPTSELGHSVQFAPIQVVARSFDTETIHRLKTLPLVWRPEGKSGDSILFCHASPSSNRKGWHQGLVDSGLDAELELERASVLVSGHWHDPRETQWKDKSLITAGSVGIPLSGWTEAEYLILERTERGWAHRHLREPYDVQATLEDYVESGWLSAGAPISWILLYEVETAQRKMVRLFPWLARQALHPSTREQWENAIRSFFIDTGGWDVVSKYL